MGPRVQPPAGRERLIAVWTRAPLAVGAEEMRALAEAGPYQATRSMVRVRVCMESWELATPNCPSTRMLEYVSGQEPTRFCSLHGARSRHRARRHRHPRKPVASGAPAAVASGDNPAPGDSTPPG